MWQAIQNIFTSANANQIIVMILLLAFILIIGIKKGIISFNGHGLSVGIRENEAKIRR